MLAEVYLWKTRIGVVSQDKAGQAAIFNYDDDFLHSNIQVSPIVMPLNRTVYSFPELEYKTFNGLPGLLADSLPDKYGTKLLERYLSDNGRDIKSLTAVERLLYTGERGMGALEYKPYLDYVDNIDELININNLSTIASQILEEKKNLSIKNKDNAINSLIKVGSSAGGARAKAVVAWNKKTNEFRSGQTELKSGFEYWLVKFDGITNNSDKSGTSDEPGYTRIEYAYYLMAKSVGISMNECQLYNEGNNKHFMTKRFDRGNNNEKLHMQTLGALAHFDYNIPGVYSYEQTASIMSKIGLKNSENEQLFRRMIFNILSRNQDDHVKNISFIMRRNGVWELSPAYDITYAYDKNNYWLSKHQMSVNGKTEDFCIQDFYDAGRKMNITKKRIGNIIEEVLEGVKKWEDFADIANVREDSMYEIKQNHIVEIQ